MNEEITLVTAFFNIGRENFKAIPRSDSIYFKNFEAWARMRNKLIVYTQPQMSSIIMDIRKNFRFNFIQIINFDNYCLFF